MSASIKSISKRKPVAPPKWGKENNRGIYGSNRWRKLSERFRMNNPLCRVCEEPTQMTDHIKPISEGGAIWDEANLQPLCNKCHRNKTRNER